MTNLPPEITDAHHHIWNPVSSTPDIGYKWLRDIGAMKPFGDPTPIQRDYLWPEFLSEVGDAARISGSVHVQADGAIPDPVAETAFVSKTAAMVGHRLAVVGFVDLAADDAVETIRRHTAFDVFRGVRQILSRLDDQPQTSFAGEHYLRNPRWCTNYRQLAAFDLSFDAQLCPEQMEEAAEFFADHRTIPVIIDHAGSPHDQSEEGFQVWQRGMSALAALPHTSVKLSGFGMFNPNWDEIWLTRYVDHVADQFGESRIMFGSNYPVENLARTYAEMLEMLSAVVGRRADLEKVFSGNARRIYRL